MTTAPTQNINETFNPILQFKPKEMIHPVSIRQLLVQTIVLSLQYWHQSTFLTKLDLASESNIWSIHLGDCSSQTRTLDKYLHIKTLPKRPKVEDVIRTAHFVLSRGDSFTPLRSKLEQTLDAMLKFQQNESISP